MRREKTMSEMTTIGLDLAKDKLQVVGCDARGKVLRKKLLRRPQGLGYFANLPPCLVAMEACAGAHHRARPLMARGHPKSS
jgi:transposase